MNGMVNQWRLETASNASIVPNHTPTFSLVAGHGEKHAFSKPPFIYLDFLVPRVLDLIS